MPKAQKRSEEGSYGPFSPTCGTVRAAVELTMITLDGSVCVAPFSSMGWNNCTILKTPRTFRSSILADDQSGVVSNGPPHVAPALATKMSIWSVCCLTASTNLATSSRFPTSAAMPTAWPLMPESAFSRLTAWSMPCSPPALRAVTMTSLAPWRRKAVAACSPRPREPGNGSVEILLTPFPCAHCLTSGDNCNLPLKPEEILEVWKIRHPAYYGFLRCNTKDMEVWF